MACAHRAVGRRKQMGPRLRVTLHRHRSCPCPRPVWACYMEAGLTLMLLSTIRRFVTKVLLCDSVIVRALKTPCQMKLISSQWMKAGRECHHITVWSLSLERSLMITLTTMYMKAHPAPISLHTVSNSHREQFTISHISKRSSLYLFREIEMTVRICNGGWSPFLTPKPSDQRKTSHGYLQQEQRTSCNECKSSTNCFIPSYKTFYSDKKVNNALSRWPATSLVCPPHRSGDHRRTRLPCRRRSFDLGDLDSCTMRSTT